MEATGLVSYMGMVSIFGFESAQAAAMSPGDEVVAPESWTALLRF